MIDGFDVTCGDSCRPFYPQKIRAVPLKHDGARLEIEPVTDGLSNGFERLAQGAKFTHDLENLAQEQAGPVVMKVAIEERAWITGMCSASRHCDLHHVTLA